MIAAPEPVAWSWPAEVPSVSTARHAVVAWLSARGVQNPQLGDVALAVSEAVTNAVTHAYVGRQPGAISITVALDDEAVRLVIEDDGNGLRPRHDSPGLGYGLALMMAVSQRFETEAVEPRGTRLRLHFSRRS
jgi:serine/threonine-protein kinase RsbW